MRFLRRDLVPSAVVLVAVMLVGIIPFLPRTDFVRALGIAVGSAFLAWWGLYLTWPSHRPQWPLVLKVAFAAAIWVGFFALTALIVRYPNVAALGGAGVVGWLIGRAQGRTAIGWVVDFRIGGN